MKLTNIDIVQIIKDVIMRTDKLKYTYSKKHPNSKYTLDFIINELIYVLKSGVSWRDLRSEINYNTLYWHFKRFNNCDVFQRAFTICRNRVMKKKLGIIIIDTTIISNKYGRNKVSRKRFHKNKKCTKVSAITDVNGLPLTIIADKGSKHDLKFLNSQVRKIKKKLTAETILLADRGYVSFKHLKSLGESGVQLMAKKKKNMKIFGNFNKEIYRKRIFVEHFFQKLKSYRRLQMRYDSYLRNFNGFLYLASALIFSK